MEKVKSTGSLAITPRRRHMDKIPPGEQFYFHPPHAQQLCRKPDMNDDFFLKTEKVCPIIP